MMKAKRYVPVLIWALLLLPFFLGACAAHPATDDFTFAAYTHPTWMQTGSILHVLKDALSYALRTWRDWQGTFTGIVIMTLNPAVFAIEHYGVHAVILLIAHIASWMVFLFHMLGRRLGVERQVCRKLTLALSAISLMFLPDIVEGIYWFNGAWFYTGAQAAALMTLVLCDRLCEYRGGRMKTVLFALICAGLLFALGMDNYITAMMTAAAVFMMALQRLWAKDKREALRMALLLVPIGIGLLLSVVAPGNAVRMERDGAHQSGMGWLLMSFVWTMRDAVFYIVRFSLKTPLLALLVVLTPALCRALRSTSAEKAKRCPPVWAAALGFYLILCAMIIPHMYSSGYAGSGRVVNMYHLYVIIALPLVWVMALMRLAPGMRENLSRTKMQRISLIPGAALLVLCLVLGQLGNYAKLVSDQLDGTQKAYIAQFRQEYALCEAGGTGDDVVLPAWTVQTVTGKPTAYDDAAAWTNESMAHFFGVKSVRVGK